jgi:hypothetical protein
MGEPSQGCEAALALVSARMSLQAAPIRKGEISRNHCTFRQRAQDEIFMHSHQGKITTEPINRSIIMQNSEINIRSECGYWTFYQCQRSAGWGFSARCCQRLPERIRVSMTSLLAWHRWGLAAVGYRANMPVMVLATLVGALIGEFCYLERGINNAVSRVQKRMLKPGQSSMRLLFKATSPSSCCFAPAAPGFLVQCMKA